LGPDHFPAEWAAVRQFELLQDAGNYRVYNMQADYMMRSIFEATRSMTGGGYRVTVAMLGSYRDDEDKDELEIIDQRLQKRLSQIIHMLYLEEQSAGINQGHDTALAEGHWDFRTAIPHVGMTLGARDLFRPLGGGIRPGVEKVVVPPAPHSICMPGWSANLRVCDASNPDHVFRFVDKTPIDIGSFTFRSGTYVFARGDEGRTVNIHYMRLPSSERSEKLSSIENKHRLAQKFFNVLGQLPQKHIVHDTAVGLQLPESINEQEWLYVPEGAEQMFNFSSLLADVFRPFDIMSLSALDGRADAKTEIKPGVQHMRGHGDRLTPHAAAFQQQMAKFTL